METPPRGGRRAGFGAFLIFHATISAFDADDGNTIPEYTGLVAFSDSEEHGVLQLDYYSRHSLSACCNVKHLNLYLFLIVTIRDHPHKSVIFLDVVMK